MDATLLLNLAVYTIPIAIFMVFSLTGVRSTLKILSAALVLALVAAIVFHGVTTISERDPWDTETFIAYSVSFLAFWGVPMLCAAVAITIARKIARSKLVHAAFALVAAALAFVPAFSLTLSIGCAWMGDCI